MLKAEADASQRLVALIEACAKKPEHRDTKKNEKKKRGRCKQHPEKHSIASSCLPERPGFSLLHASPLEAGATRRLTHRLVEALDPFAPELGDFAPIDGFHIF